MGSSDALVQSSVVEKVVQEKASVMRKRSSNPSYIGAFTLIDLAVLSPNQPSSKIGIHRSAGNKTKYN